MRHTSAGSTTPRIPRASKLAVPLVKWSGSEWDVARSSRIRLCARRTGDHDGTPRVRRCGGGMPRFRAIEFRCPTKRLAGPSSCGAALAIPMVPRRGRHRPGASRDHEVGFPVGRSGAGRYLPCADWCITGLAGPRGHTVLRRAGQRRTGPGSGQGTRPWGSPPARVPKAVGDLAHQVGDWALPLEHGCVVAIQYRAVPWPGRRRLHVPARSRRLIAKPAHLGMTSPDARRTKKEEGGAQCLKGSCPPRC